jgi:A/G-specific adenine glycosylase
MTPDAIKRFQEVVYAYFSEHGRSFPWRGTADPYQILVSEIMLQQTQVDRVRDKYVEFIAAFPTLFDLAQASLQQVLERWQGLGYNRRAIALHAAAQEVIERFDGVIPGEEAALQSLPGIGPYTAAAVLAFAFNRPTVVIDTNIRAVFIHCFFNEPSNIRDAELRPLIEQTMDRLSPRTWYAALMDFGALLKKEVTNPSRHSAHYARQPPFEGSDRQLRGRILKEVLARSEVTIPVLLTTVEGPEPRVLALIDQLVAEGFFVRICDRIRIA